MIEISTPKLFTLQLKDLLIPPDRCRKEFTRIAEMAESIQKLGIIHPIVVAPHPDKEGKFILVAGERRYRGAVMAGCSEVPATLREEATDVLAEIELEENTCRANITFEEEGDQLSKIQELKKQKNQNWGIKDTAQMTNRSVGDVAGKIKISRKFKERPDLKEACKNLPYTAALKKIDQIEEAEKVKRLSSSGELDLSPDLYLGNCLQLIKTIADESVDMVLTDPPYGIEKLEQIRKPKGSTKMINHQLMSDTHNMTLDSVCEMLSALAPELSRVLKPGSHWYMFCGFQMSGRFIQCLEPFLEFQAPVLIWDRGRPTTGAYGYNYMSRCECILYGYKPPRSRRLNEDMYQLIECPDVPKTLRMYPTEKPVPLLKTFIKQSSSHAGVVLDPFAGSGSTLEAAKTLGRRGIGFEINEESYLRAQKRLKDVGE